MRQPFLFPMTDTEPTITQLDNGGVIVRGKGGRFLPGTRPANIVKTSDDARSLALRRQELKRQRVEAGANAALAELEPDKWASPSDLDFAEAIAEAAMHKALNPDDAKQVDAARFLLQEAGLSEQRGVDQQPTVIRHEYSASPELLALLREVRQARDNYTYSNQAVEGSVAADSGSDADAGE